MIHSLRLPGASGASAAENPKTTSRDTLNQNGLPYLAIAFFVLLAWVGYECRFPIPVFPLDDAYIVIHNAQVLLSGKDLNFVGASPLTGTTSVVHLALVSALMLFLQPLVALSASLWIAILLYALGLVRLARVNGLGRSASVLAALLGLTAGQVPYQLLNGLETGMALAAVTWALTLLSGPERLTSRILPALCGTLPFIRPDLMPLALMFLGLQTGHHWRIRESVPSFLRRAGSDLAVACLFALPWAIWSWSESGSIFPSTINAKRFFFAQSGWNGAVKLQFITRGLFQFGSNLGLLTVFSLFLVRTWIGRIGIAFASVLIFAYYLQYPTALISYAGRYLYPLLPFILLGAIYALKQVKPNVRIAAVLVFALGLGQSLKNAPGVWARNANSCDFTVQEIDGVAEWCNQNLPPASTLLIHDAGYISCKTRFHLVDFVGLKTPSSTVYHKALTYPSDGRNRGQAISEIALQARTNYLIVLDNWDRDFSITSSLEAEGWKIRLINSDYAYKVYALRPPGSISTARSISSGVL